MFSILANTHTHFLFTVILFIAVLLIGAGKLVVVFIYVVLIVGFNF